MQANSRTFVLISIMLLLTFPGRLFFSYIRAERNVFVQWQALPEQAVLEVLPFDNYLYVVTLSGTDLISLFNHIASINQGAGGFPQVSKEISYTITYDENGMKGEISNILINGEKINPEKNYKIAVSNYLATGGDGYEILTKSIDTFNTSMLMSDVVIDYAKTFKTAISPTTDERIIIIGGIDIE